ncbi:protein-disulfide reductase DsbD [Kangiella sediminilitoris]|uniref:Thiol:disulfide interchange protein DsbD n=1 Tax=Kangiella sediminilitoris TaxID=1144748 RepID=A0A1B3BDG8_9GAMM|nr:protein-disulfide reductase DsbD [Kangiella sediminilitoris]AOE50840.1 Thiol:disulfide interchange protein DsbD [Kangiella sediminilitoris]
MKKILMTTLLFLFSSTLLQATQKPIDLSSILNDQEELLTVEEAFQLSVDIVDDKALIKFDIADGYYMYSERLNVSSPDAQLGQFYVPEGKEKDDPYLGLTQVHYQFLEASVDIIQADGDFTLVVGYQGCAEDRLCYPPTTTDVALNHTVNIASNDPAQESSDKAQAVQPTENKELFVSEQQKHTEYLTTESLLSNFSYFLLLGLALTFTPCVFPMIPIISGIIAGQGKNITTRKAFFLSLTYTQAMAIVYTILGIVVALAGQSISGYFQSPGVVITAAVIFVLLSLSMFGFYELQLPSSLQAKLSEKSNQQKKGSYVGTAIMGGISALIVSPCVTVPLIAILLVIAQSGDVVLGAVSLYGLGVGMGIPLIIIGVTEGKFLPKAGPWMTGIKAAFGVAMLGVALYLVKHLLPSSIYMYGWGLLAIIPGFFLFNNQLKDNGWKTFIKGLGLVAMLYGALLIIGGSQGQRNLLQPLQKLGQTTQVKTTASAVQAGHLEFKRIKSLSDLNQEVEAANAQGKTVMLDLFAEWCASCYEFEEKVFTDPGVIEALNNTVLLQADVTDNDAIDIELMQAYDVLGLPSIMFFDKNGTELSSLRANGFEEADAFRQRINAAFGQ